MAGSNEVTNFDIIEDHKENIQSLPGGRSAKKLAELFSPSPLHQLSTPTPTDTRNVNDCIRAEYEAEIQNISESDDPLDVFDRYVRWTLDAYPSAQSTPQSQLHTLLERATRAFVSSSQYKNDPRYLKFWMQYIQFFSDSPRETYIFLSRHSIGESLALFYEEYAAWLEEAGRLSQAKEVYILGIEREARPIQRLLRKFREFEQRLAQQPDAVAEPSSPALPLMRPALAARVDPFDGTSRPADLQASIQGSGVGRPSAKPSKSKLAIFSDVDTKSPVLSSRDSTSKGWDTIGSLADRKKENVMEPKPWAGETLKAGGKKPATPKLTVFKDPSLLQIQNILVVPSKHQVTVHPQTGRREYIFVDLAAIYRTPEEPGTELSFEEVIATNRGWFNQTWDSTDPNKKVVPDKIVSLRHIGPQSQNTGGQLALHQESVLLDENGQVKEKAKESRTMKKKKVTEVNETQIIKAKLDSPSGPRLRRKNTSDPTMTLHTKAATDDIYEIFNAPLKSNSLESNGSGGDEEDYDYESDGDYTTDGESTATTKQIDPSGHDETAEVKSAIEWSDFSARKDDPRHLLRVVDVTSQEDNLISASEKSSQSDADPNTWSYESDGPELPVIDTFSPTTRTIFIPIPPEDYEPPTRPYRDPAEVANNRLPFMTPITERTESSLDVDLERAEHFKTPCRRDGNSKQIEGQSNLEPLSSPLREIITDEKPHVAMERHPLTSKSNRALAHGGSGTPMLIKGPIILEAQCCPVDQGIRQDILEKARPPLAAYQDYYDHRHQKYERGSEIRKFAKALSKIGKGSADKSGPAQSPLIIEFPDCSSKYALKRELGAGAFAPVYLVESSTSKGEEHDQENAAMSKGTVPLYQRTAIEALKMESPPTSWEFYIMRLAHSRLGPQHRASVSLSYAHELHLYQDEAFLFLPFYPHGTLLDVVNFFHAEPSGVMDEQLVMFFAIELFRTVEALHSKDILHGDLKPDNCLLRLDNSSWSNSFDQTISSQWSADGTGGWASRGIVLIDFGRGIDLRAFVPDVEFIADWKTSVQDCPEMREGRPWTWQMDYYGLAGIIHCLLFGKYIETTRADQGGLGRTGRKYRIKESLKRYWQTDIWSDCFEVLLNPASFLALEAGGKMPALKSMRGIRERMESWLEANCERGIGLKSAMSRVEAFAKSRK